MRHTIRSVVDHHPEWVVAALFAYLTVFGLVAVFAIIRTYHVASETHRSACALKVDVSQRIDSAQDFLKRHPQGIDGVSRGDIQLTIANEQRTLHSFRFLDC